MMEHLMKSKITHGNWEPIYQHYPKEPKRICTGVGINTNMPGGIYTEFVCNSILPNTDEEYIEYRDEIEANMKLIAAAPDMLEVLQVIIHYYDSELKPSILEAAERAINKATNGKDE